MITEQRLNARLKRMESGCWTWTGSIFKNGYGRFNDGRYVHRVSYETWVGPIPDGLSIDHLCRNRACGNPAHLEPVTIAENLHRGAVARLKTLGVDALTPRQALMVGMVLGGMRQNEVANQLGLSLQTVKNTLRNARRRS